MRSVYVVALTLMVVALQGANGVLVCTTNSKGEHKQCLDFVHTQALFNKEPLPADVHHAIGGELVYVTDDLCKDVDPSQSSLLKGTIVLVQRGDCKFDVKAKNAENLGASGLVIFDNVKNEMIYMNSEENDDVVNIPSVFVSKEEGEGILKLAMAAKKAGLGIDVFLFQADSLMMMNGNMVYFRMIRVMAFSVFCICALLFIRSLLRCLCCCGRKAQTSSELEDDDDVEIQNVVVGIPLSVLTGASNEPKGKATVVPALGQPLLSKGVTTLV